MKTLIMRTLQTVLENHLVHHEKSVLLLGPRQVGKSHLLKQLNPDLVINLAKESEYRDHVKDPNLLNLKVFALEKPAVVFIDEVQRIPSFLNTVQSIVDDHKGIQFLISGSSARKLRKNEINLLPGRIFSYRLLPLTYWELGEKFELEMALKKGSLPEVYLEDYGADLLGEYIDTYLREEIMAEALVRNIASFSHFLDTAALLSGQEINYSKIASDCEIPKETLRRYFDLLEETLIIQRIPSYSKVKASRKVRQKEKFVFFDLGVRNGILKIQHDKMSSEQMGALFEQWIFLQILTKVLYKKLDVKISYYRDDRNLEVDFVIETKTKTLALEIKWGQTYRSSWTEGLKELEGLSIKKITPILIYRGEHELKDQNVKVLPYQNFLNQLDIFLENK